MKKHTTCLKGCLSDLFGGLLVKKNKFPPVELWCWVVAFIANPVFLQSGFCFFLKRLGPEGDFHNQSERICSPILGWQSDRCAMVSSVCLVLYVFLTKRRTVGSIYYFLLVILGKKHVFFWTHDFKSNWFCFSSPGIGVLQSKKNHDKTAYKYSFGSLFQCCLPFLQKNSSYILWF